ncbi:hypothetical protein C9994_17920, partial [Marivirga lumbricoides]
GLSLLKTIRKKDQYTPVIFLTAKSRTEDVIEGFKYGANDYIKKPFSMEELIVKADNASSPFWQYSTLKPLLSRLSFTMVPKETSSSTNRTFAEPLFIIYSVILKTVFPFFTDSSIVPLCFSIIFLV